MVSKAEYLTSGEVGISEDMVGQALQEALNFVVCVPSTMNEENGMGGSIQDNLTGGMMMQ
jgi:hypothetical protein